MNSKIIIIGQESVEKIVEIEIEKEIDLIRMIEAKDGNQEKIEIVVPILINSLPMVLQVLHLRISEEE